MSVRRILVGVDGSAYAQRALGWSIDLARAVGAEIVAVHALGLLAHPAPGEHIPSAGHRDEIEARFTGDWCAALDTAGVPCKRVLHDGNPVAVLLAVADDEDVDLVVIGTRGVGGFPEQLLGSTAHQVAERSTRPVVIVPPARA